MQKVKLSGAVPLFLLLLLAGSQAQDTEVYFLTLPVSKNKSITYKREIRYDDCKKLYKVQDYLENGQIQMAGGYSKFDRGIKEGLWCHYRSNVKEGEFKVWYGNGQLKSRTNFRKGLRHGLHEYWYQNGRKESVQYYKKGQKHGLCTWWYEDGRIQNRRRYKRGVNQNPLRVRYEYLVSLPKNYEAEKGKTWPLIIYLHGGSHRGENLKLLYGYGIPDQIYRGREFPFIIAAPQCQINHRWSTDDWFEDFFDELCAKYRIDGRRVYLTGLSLGGSGTWYLAGKYPDIFAAIAPISGLTGPHFPPHRRRILLTGGRKIIQSNIFRLLVRPLRFQG